MNDLRESDSSTSGSERWALAVWRCLPDAWLGDLRDARVRAEVVHTISQKHALTLVVHLLIVAAYAYFYPAVRSQPWLQMAMALFVVIAVERIRLQRWVRRKSLSAHASIRLLLWSVLCSSAAAVFLSATALYFLQVDHRGLNSPAVFVSVGYYFSAVLKNISVRLVSMAFNALLLAPLMACFFLQGQPVDATIGVFLLVLMVAMAAYAKTMETLFTSRIRQAFELESMAAALIAARDQADAANRSKSSFLAAASHDLRQPVHALGLYLGLVRQEAVPAPLRSAMEGIRRSWQAVDELLAQILELSQAESQDFQRNLEAVSLAPLLRDMSVRHSAHAARASQRVVVLCKAGVSVQADAFLLGRVLSNLLDNALKYAPRASTVVLAVRARGTCWAIQVRDAGPGMASADQARVFEPFFQINNPERARIAGYGIGLSIVQRLVQAMEGQLLIRSALGQGTCMEVRLPRVATPIPTRGDAPSVPHASLVAPALQLDARVRARIEQSGRMILFVDDDPLVLDAAAQMLAHLELPHLCVASAEQALRQLPHALALISDLRLPGGLDGRELAHRFLAQGVPTLLVTGESRPLHENGGISQGMTCMHKPVNSRRILDWLEAVI